MTERFADRLADAVSDKGSALVVGLDPALERLPEAVRGPVAERGTRREAADAIRRFNAAVVEEVAPYACAVKPQIAYYEAWGPPGLEAYEDTIRLAHEAGLLVISDVKRGDIGSTAAAYARAHLLDETAGDAITVNPYLGTDSIRPFLDACETSGGGLFVLVRTSNPSATELQDLEADGRRIHEHVAELVRRWGATLRGRSGYSSVGAVVGATAPDELARLRELLPGTWFLIPGVGAQGATAADVAAAFDERGLGAVVNSSRGILYAFGDPSTADWRPAVAAAARELRDQLREASGTALTRNGP